MEQIKNPSPYLIPGIPEDKKPKMWERKKELRLVEIFDPAVTIDIIIELVTKATSISKEQIISPSRKREIVQARYITMYLCAKYMTQDISLKGIAYLLRGQGSTRDHTSVITGRDAIVHMLHGRICGDDVVDTLKYLESIEKHLKQTIDESNRAYWQSRQR
jgi:chromosomal replication initiator protein